MKISALFPPIFSILVGLGMIIQWSISYFSQQIPELRSEPIRILFHIGAEFVTALALIAAGIGLLGQWSWGHPLYLIAAGMLLYTAITSPGYFAQQGQRVWLFLFGILILLTLVSVWLIL